MIFHGVSERTDPYMLQVYIFTKLQLPCICVVLAWHIPRYTSLVSPSLTRRQANSVEFATKVWFSLFGGSEVIARLTLGIYEGEVVQRVATQNLVTCIACRYTYEDRS